MNSDLYFNTALGTLKASGSVSCDSQNFEDYLLCIKILIVPAK